LLDPIPKGHVASQGVRWVREWRTGEVVTFRVGRAGEDLVAEWTGAAELRASRFGERVSFVPRPEVRSEWADKLRRGQVKGLLRHLDGRLSLHGSGASKDGAAVAFLGDSGSGKSTTVAELCRHHAFEMLADDVLFLEESAGTFEAVPSESNHWLCADAAEFLGAIPHSDFKTSVPTGTQAQRPARLSMIVKLVFDPTIECPKAQRITGSRAFLDLGSSVLRFVVDDRLVDLHDLGLLARLHQTSPMYELRRPPGLASLAASIQVVRELIDREREAPA
jgi:hypothetical protein